VKSPDSPQEVLGAGAALVVLDETGTTVSGAEAELAASASVDGDASPPIVMVTVTKVGARGVISPRIFVCA
jgi:hypothetical protein